MATSVLRYVAIGSLSVSFGVALADSIYLRPAWDDTVSVGSLPTMQRYDAYAKSNAVTRHQGDVAFPVGEGICRGATCDKAHFDSLINDVAQAYGVDSALLHAVVTVESRYNPSARGPNGAAGLMQLMPGTARRYGVTNVFDPEQNLRGGARYLRDLLEKFGSDVSLAVAAYQAGELNVLRYKNSVPPFRTTMDYVSKVLGYYNRFRAAAGR